MLCKHSHEGSIKALLSREGNRRENQRQEAQR
jgi:hypothetical protein